MKIEMLKRLFTDLGVSPLKRYGQNFLINDDFVKRIMDYIHLKLDRSYIVEIGPGLGAITFELSKLYHVFAIEIDRKYAEYLKTFRIDNLTVVQQNALKYDFPQSCSVVSNLPYYISTELVEHLIIHSNHIHFAFLMAQREFVDKLFGKPGEDTYGPLAILVQWAGKAERIFEVPYQAFYPEPGVVSTFFCLEFNQLHSRETNYAFFLFIKKIFNNRRKTILNNLEQVVGDRLRAEDILNQLDIQLTLRPDDLTPEQFFSIFRLI